MPPDSGPEPTGWELMRAITEIKQIVRDSAREAVQQKVYDADKKGNDERHARAEGRLRDLEAVNVREAEQKQARADDLDKMRRTSRLTISLAIASPFLAAIVGIFTNGLTP